MLAPLSSQTVCTDTARRSFKFKLYHYLSQEMERAFDDICSSEEDEEGEVNPEHTNEKKKYKSKVGAILFLIDTRRRMFQSEFSDDESSLMASLKCIRDAIRHKIFDEEKCYCGIILMGTKNKDNDLNLGNLTVIQDLKLIEVNHILSLNKVIKSIENSSFINEYGCDGFSFGDAFWLATHIFYNRAPAHKKRIILFTGDDDPVTADKNDYGRALASAQDMYMNLITLELIYLGTKLKENQFLKKLLQASSHDVNCPIPDPVHTSKEMMKQIIKTNYKHLTLTKLPFVIGEDFVIGVSVSYLIKKRKVPFKVNLSKATNERVNTKMQYFEADTGFLVDETHIIKSECFGRKEIIFNMKELKSIYGYGDAQLKLLGFKPASVISLENFVKPCAFIYPDDTVYKGSSIFFTSLLKRCVAKQVVPICTLCMKPLTAIRFVALIAQNERSEVEKGTDLPQGFIALFLPFSEEIRPNEDKETIRAEPEQVEIAKKIIKKLKFKYNVDCFSNPRLQKHWAAVEALALDLPKPESISDSTYPNYDLISHRLGDLAEEFTSAVYEEDYDPEISGAPKRKTKAPPTKINLKKVESLLKNGEGNTLTNDVLKSYLKSVGEGKNLSKIKKSHLLEKAQKYLEKKNLLKR